MAEADQSSTPHPTTLNGTPAEEAPTTQLMTSNITTPEVPTPVKKPRKPRPPKIVTKLTAVSETTPTTQEAQLPLEFWAGLMQTQKVIMARRKSERYNSFRIT